jgi:hypothetical protein
LADFAPRAKFRPFPADHVAMPGQNVNTGGEVAMKSGIRILREGSARAARAIVLGAPKKW